MKHSFEEAESFYVAGKLIKDMSLIEVSTNLLKGIDAEMSQWKQETSEGGGSKEGTEEGTEGGSEGGSKDQETEILQGRVVSWSSMTESALGRHEEALENGERAAKIFERLEDVTREFATLDNLFLSAMKLYISHSDSMTDEAEKKRKELVLRALGHCDRMELLVEESTPLSLAKGESGAVSGTFTLSQVSQVEWRKKHLQKLLKKVRKFSLFCLILFLLLADLLTRKLLFLISSYFFVKIF